MKKLSAFFIAILTGAFAYGQTSPRTNTTVVSKNLTTASAATNINLETIDEWLCPKSLERGDREFDGHGPRIKSEVKLRLTNNGTEIWADITFSAIETVHDWSTTSGKWTRKVYDAPYGKKISSIVSDQASRTSFISPPAGFQFIVPGQDVAQAINKLMDGVDIENKIFQQFGIVRTDREAVKRLFNQTVNSGNTVNQLPATEGALVKYFHIVGDTGGADISDDDNCNDDTRIVKIEFFPASVIMVNR